MGFQSVESVAASTANQSAVATLEPLQGLVEHLPSGTSQWQTVNNLIQVGQGDQIRTDASGWALLTFFTGASTEIFAETQVSLEVLQTPDSEGVFQVSLRQLAGSTINSVSSILDSRSQFDVTTPNITATVRGTNFAIRLTDPNLTTISVREGQVETQSSDPDAEPILLEAGQSLTYTGDEAGEILNELDYPTPPPAPQSQQPSPPAQTVPVASGGFTPVGDALLCGGQPVSIPGR